MSSMILRSFHIPVEMDVQLEQTARKHKLAKSELVRHFIAEGMKSNAIMAALPDTTADLRNSEIDQSARRSRGLRGRSQR